MIYRMKYKWDMDYQRKKGSNTNDYVIMDDTTLDYVRRQTAITLFDYLRDLDAVYLPSVIGLRGLCDDIYDKLGHWLEENCPQALQDPNTLPARQRRRYRTTLAVTNPRA